TWAEPGLTLTYSATGLPPGLGIDTNSGLISGTIAPGAGNGAPYNVVVTISAGTLSVSQTFAWTVSNLLSVSGPEDQNNVGGDTVSLPVTASGPDGVALTFSAAGLPNGLTM